MNGTIFAADLYSGAGGASTGLHRAADRLGARVHLVAVNHWQTAIDTHSSNFPGVAHYCSDVAKVNPREAVPGGRLTLLMAGPSCVHHSIARGGKPVSDQQRASAWDIIRWLEELYVENVLIENVPEFQGWGPLDEFDVPVKLLKGTFFRQFCDTIRELGYTVEHRVLNAAHYGDATTRRRLFIQARRNGPIVWPKPTHMPPADLASFPGTEPWIAARDIIDWTLPSQSIYGRKKPLCNNTLARIFAGLEKFSGLAFMLGQQSGYAPRSVNDPVPVIATAGKIAFVQPFLVVLKGTGERQLRATAQALERPLPALCSGGNMALCESFIVPHFGEREGQKPRTHGLDDPLPTVTGQGAGSLITPFLVGVGGPRGSQQATGIDAPFGTLLAQNHKGVCEPFLVRYNGGDDRFQPVTAPVGTLDTSNRYGLAEPFLVSYYGNGEALSIHDPLDSITTKDRFGLVELRELLDKGDQLAWLDIRFRMLQLHELAAAHSFPKAYKFSGSRQDGVKQVGNSWPVNLGAALCEAMLRGNA